MCWMSIAYDITLEITSAAPTNVEESVKSSIASVCNLVYTKYSVFWLA